MFFTGLHSHDSNHGMNSTLSQMELTFQDSQVSQNSSDDRLSIVISEDTKMDVDLETKTVTPLTGSEAKTMNDAALQTQVVTKSQEDKKYHKDKKFDRKFEEKKRDEKRVKKTDDKRDEQSSEKKKEKKDKKGDKHVSKSSDKISKSSSNSESKVRERDKYKDTNLSTSKHSSEYKHKEIDKKVAARKGTDSNTKGDMNRRNDQKNSDKKDAQSKDSDKKSKSKYASLERGDKFKKKEKDEKDNKEKSDDEKSKDKANRDKEGKLKDTPEKEREKLHREKSDKKKEPAVDKSDRSKEREKSSSSKGGSNHSSSNAYSKERRRDKETSSKGSSKYKDKTKRSEDDSKSKHKKDTKRNKQSGDDHYGFKDKTRNRRSTDRDSNDDNTERSRHINVDNTISTSSQKHSSDAGDTTSSGGGNNSGNSDKAESENSPKSPEDVTSKAQSNEVEKVKYIKPKFASNLKEAMRIMKIRRQIAKLERQNQLSFIAIDGPFINGVTSKKDTQEEGTEIIENVKHCEKVLNIVLDRNDGMVVKAVAKEAIDVENFIQDENSVQNKEVANDKSEYFVEQQRFVLQTKDLSKENWEALEARLAEEMSNVDCRSYDYCDDYDCSDSEVVINSTTTDLNSATIKIHNSDKNGGKDNTYTKRTMTVINTMHGDDTTLLEPICKHKARSDNNHLLTNLETFDDSKMGQNKDLAISKAIEVIKESLLPENITDNEVISTERSEIENYEKDPDMSYVVDDGVIASPGSVECERVKLTTTGDVTMTQGIGSSVKYHPIFGEEEVTTILTDKPDMVEEIQFVEQVAEVGQDISVEPTFMEPTAPVEEVIVTADNSKPDNVCRYLEMPTPYMKKNLANLYRFIGKLEADIEHCIKACQNNFAPVEVRGMKRKFNAIIDIKNNNRHHDDGKVSANGE
ncbi:unnamed protein product [Callosobruchus maculatus]|uniref:Uncharacterized protein n=1 Tax=Callosobruchus maculatus TaxID=64391 RepID=A0A653D0T3_CALMS|nr:unnamed protein product [Callosobruchus maculatus]